MRAAGLPPLATISPPVVGWQVTLYANGRVSKMQDCEGAEDGFAQAQDAGRAWLARHGQDSISQWMAQAAQASRRMAWDHDYRQQFTRRGF